MFKVKPPESVLQDRNGRFGQKDFLPKLRKSFLYKCIFLTMTDTQEAVFIARNDKFEKRVLFTKYVTLVHG